MPNGTVNPFTYNAPYAGGSVMPQSYFDQRADLYKSSPGTTLPTNTKPTNQATSLQTKPTSTAASNIAPRASGLVVGAGGTFGNYAPVPGLSYPQSTPSSGGGGGGGGSSFTINNVGGAMSPMPDLSGLIESFGSMLNKQQEGDVPEALPVQKNTMELQALREAGAGWNEQNIGGMGVNPQLGQRIPADETKKLAASGQSRIY
jgi:hypothetical protein